MNDKPIPLPEYKKTVHQIANAKRRGIKRRYTEAYQEAQKRRFRARSAANRLARSIRQSDGPVDASIIGLQKKLQRIGETRVVGRSWRQPRPGRRS